MGNSASLPSLESIGRPLGTGRPSVSSFTRHLDRQTETRSPVERLEADAEAGGRRRTRSEAQEGHRRDRRGPRPEELREERREAQAPNRRGSEAAEREASEARRTNEGSSPSAARPLARRDGSGPPTDPDAPDAFGARLKAQLETSEVHAAAPKAAGASAEPGELPAGAAALLFNAPATPTGGSVAIPSAAPSTAAVGRAAALPAAAAPAAAPPTPSAETPGATREAARPAPELPAEAREAQRAADVLRQFRMHLHPGLRTATLQLAPAELGRLSIRIRVEGERVQAVVRADSEETLRALERHVPELEATFSDQGFEELALELGLADDFDTETTPQGARDASRELAALVETETDSDDTSRVRSNAVGVDTYA